MEDLTTLEDLDYGALYLFWRLGWFDDSWRITLWRILLYLEDFAIFGDFAILEAWLGDLEGVSWLLFVGWHLGGALTMLR